MTDSTSGDPEAALAYRGSELYGLEIDPRALKETTREWEEKGYRVELTTHEDAVETWWAWRRRKESR